MRKQPPAWHKTARQRIEGFSRISREEMAVFKRRGIPYRMFPAALKKRAEGVEIKEPDAGIRSITHSHYKGLAVPSPDDLMKVLKHLREKRINKFHIVRNRGRTVTGYYSFSFTKKFLNQSPEQIEQMLSKIKLEGSSAIFQGKVRIWLRTLFSLVEEGYMRKHCTPMPEYKFDSKKQDFVKKGIIGNKLI
ncbi:MAG: hypothetical protein PHD95_04015 [Candidatus ainarchaeum sp.]|nr:hypothetical protein [Candidatus ainarchaeum sp.]